MKCNLDSPRALISVVSLVFVPLLSSIVFPCACFASSFPQVVQTVTYAPAKLASDVVPTSHSVSFESSLAHDNLIGEIAEPPFEHDNVNKLDGVEVGTHLGQLAPDFTLSNTEGRSVALNELRGQDILLVFWNIRCPYCAAKIPLLNEVEEGGLKVVSVALGATATQVTKYIEDWNIRFDILPDTHRTVGRAYSVRAVPQPFWIDAEGTILWSGPENGPEIWSYLSGQETQANPSLYLEAYVVPYVGDIDGSVESGWFAFYDRLRRWHDAESIPGSFSFYPETMNSVSFNQIIADMYTSKNMELVLKGEDQYQGRRLDYMTYSEVKQALQAWQGKFVYGLEQLEYSDIEIPVTYNQLLQRFTETIRDAAHDVGFQMYFEQGISDEYGYIDMLPDFDITQYNVPLTTTGMPGPETVFKQPEQIIQDVLDFEDERMLYINGIKVVPLLCHHQDFQVSETSSVANEEKFGIYTTLLTMADDDPRIRLLRPKDVYDLRHKYLGTHILTDFEAGDHGWIAAGIGQGQFEIGVPRSFDPDEGACLTECFGTGPSEDHSANGVNAACTNLDGHMAPFDNLYTNSLTSPVYDFKRMQKC